MYHKGCGALIFHEFRSVYLTVRVQLQLQSTIAAIGLPERLNYPSFSPYPDFVDEK